MRRTELNLFVPFFLGTAAARLRMQLSRSPVSLLQAPACTEVGSPGRKKLSPPPHPVGSLPAAGRTSRASLQWGELGSCLPGPRWNHLPFLKTDGLLNGDTQALAATPWKTTQVLTASAFTA